MRARHGEKFPREVAARAGRDDPKGERVDRRKTGVELALDMRIYVPVYFTISRVVRVTPVDPPQKMRPSMSIR